MNKLFVFDVDGTLLDNDHRLSDCVLDAINQIREKGHMITIATGRSALWSVPIIEKLEISSPYISSGGACIRNPTNNMLLYQRNIKKEHVRKLLDIAYQQKIIGVCYQNIFEVIVDEGSFSYMEPLVKGLPMEKLNSLYDFEGNIVKIDIQGTKKVLDEICRKLNEVPQFFNIAGKKTTCLEITNYRVNKGIALQELCGLLNVRHEDLIVFGNGDNDIPMFDCAGFSVAMGNSSDEVKAHADIIAPSNDEEGVAWAIRKVLEIFEER